MSQQILAEIESQESSDFSMGRRNHLTDLFCSLAGIVASFIAAVLAATSGACPWLIATVAAIPALCASLQQVFDFRGRAAWYFQKAAKLRGTILALKYEHLPEAEASQQFRETEIAMETQWSELVSRSYGVSSQKAGKLTP